MCTLLPRGGAAAASSGTALQHFLISALVTLIFEALLGHSLEFLKILKQTNPTTPLLTLLKSVTAEKGVLGMWDGFVPWGVLQSIGKGGAFGLARGFVTPPVQSLVASGYLSEGAGKVVVGGLSGGVQGYVLSPTLLLKTRVMTDAAFRVSDGGSTILKSLAVGSRVVRSEGVSALMKGSNVFATKRVFDWSTRFLFADVIEAYYASYTGSSPTDLEKMYCSMLGGMVSSVATLPLDALVAKIQDAKKAGAAASPIAMIKAEFEEGGFKGLWNSYMKAWQVRAVHVGLTTVAMKTWSPMAFQLVFGGE
jgi:hypothetical protein